MPDKVVHVQRVIDKLMKTVGDLTFRIAVLEAQLESVVESSKGGVVDGTENSVGADNGDAPSERSG